MLKSSSGLEIKALQDDGTFAGYGSVFGVVDSYKDVVERGAFKKTLAAWRAKKRWPALLWQHNHREPIGVYTRMDEDSRGLYVEGRLLIDDDPLARRAYAHMKAGSLTGLSIGYRVPKGGRYFDSKADVYRLTEIDLFEVSLVTFPANTAAQVGTVKDATAIAIERLTAQMQEATKETERAIWRSRNPGEAALVDLANSLIDEMREYTERRS